MKVRKGFHVNSWPQEDGSHVQVEATRGPGFWYVEVFRTVPFTERKMLASLIFHAEDVVDGEAATREGRKVWKQQKQR